MGITPTPLQELRDPVLEAHGVRVIIKRDDLIHPVISGNKWRKLKYNLFMARRQRYDTLLTFGGAYSNHIHAFAAAGRICGFNTIGVIRGEETLPLNPTLQFAVDCGMHLHYVDRKRYRDKSDAEFIQNLRDRFGRFFHVPEGGSNLLAMTGCSEIAAELEDALSDDFDVVACPCGTGATLAGLAAGLQEEKRVIGFAVLKGSDFLTDDVRSLLAAWGEKALDNWHIETTYHHGGYAKLSTELVDFIDGFEQRNRLALEPIYTGKMLYGLYDMIRRGAFKRGETIVAVHTGGLQGLAGLGKKIEKMRARLRYGAVH